MFLAMIFIIAKNQNPNIYELKDKRNVVCLHNGILFSYNKKNEVLINSTTWMNLGKKLSARRPHCMNPCYKMTKVGKSIETEYRLVVF